MTQLLTKQNQKTKNIFIGLDVHKNSYSFSIMQEDQVRTTKTVASNQEKFLQYLKKHFRAQDIACAYEAGPTGYALHDYLNQHGITCNVIAPTSIQKAISDRIKNDRIDSKRLTEQLQSKKLKFIRVPKGVYRELRSLVRGRYHYALLRRKTKQRIKALLLFENLYEHIKDPNKNFSISYLENLKNLPIQGATKSRMLSLLEDLAYARKHLHAVHRQLRSFVKEQPEVKKNMNFLTSIPGIGFIVATAVLAIIGNPALLRSEREIAGFLGLCPSEHSSGEKTSKGHITRFGNRMLRTLIIEAAWVTIRRDTRLNQFYYKIKSKHHRQKGAANIAIVAVARKLTTIIFRLLKEQRCYKVI